jgi:hypothetical protein
VQADVNDALQVISNHDFGLPIMRCTASPVGPGKATIALYVHQRALYGV